MDPQKNSLWAFILITSLRKKYLLSLEDLSKEWYTAQHLVKIIKNIILMVRPEKFVTIVFNNRSNIAAAYRMICEEYPNILNVKCIAHCINLINSDIVKINWIKSLIKCANSITKYFKNSHLASAWLKEVIQLKGIKGGRLKIYVEIC